MQHQSSLQFTPKSMLSEVFPATLRALHVSHPESLALALRIIKSSVLPPSRDVTLNGDVRCFVSHETDGIGSPLPLQVMTNWLLSLIMGFFGSMSTDGKTANYLTHIQHFCTLYRSLVYNCNHIKIYQCYLLLTLFILYKLKSPRYVILNIIIRFIFF